MIDGEFCIFNKCIAIIRIYRRIEYKIEKYKV